MQHLVRVLPMVALLGVGLLLLPAQSPETAACAKAPSAACLADLAVQSGLADRFPPPYIRDLAVLPMMGRFDQAQALLDHMRAAQEPRVTPAPPWDELASHRIAANIRGGMTVADAVATVPGAVSGYLHIAALDLLGRNPYAMPASAKHPPDAANRAAVAGLADTLVGMEAGLNPYQRFSALSDAAELRVLLGDVAGAKAAVALMPVDIPDPRPLSAALTLAVGPDTALAFCPPLEKCRRYALRFAAAASPPKQAKALLTEAFDLGANAHFPDADAMRDIVLSATQIGQMDLALVLARRMAQVTVERKGILPVISHIDTAAALHLAEAGAVEVRASLSRAETEMPSGSPDSIVGIGVVSGPIAWKGNGLEAEAFRSLALIRARLGDLDEALRLIELTGDPTYSWQELLVPDLPISTLDRLLSGANAALPAEEFAFRRARLAQDVLQSSDIDSATKDWALALARAALSEAPMQDDPALSTCKALAWVGHRFSDTALRDAALSHAAKIALDQGDVQSLLLAASLWHAYGPKP